MSKADREARLQHVKALGRIAYRILRQSEIEGVVSFEGENKYVREFDDDDLAGVLYVPQRADAAPTEQSEIQIRFCGRKVLYIRWDRAGRFRVLLYEPGTWERILFDWPEPIPL
jgi:hypothetical protein